MTVVNPQQFGKVAVLMGGWSAERNVSLQSGQVVLKALQENGIDAHAIDVQRESVLNDLQNGKFDRVFNILHGPGGEDGVIQGMLEILNLPYTGSGVLASALAMDKLRTKQMLDSQSLPTPAYMIMDKDTDFEYVVACLGLPLMVKPVLEGSSIGMTRVDEASQLVKAWEVAAAFSGEVIAEQWVEGSEYTVAVLNDEALPVIRLETPHAFYDYEAKYQTNDTQYICPCGLDAAEEARLQRLALSAMKVIGVAGWGRVDILCDEKGQPYIIELNTIPGMTDHSLVPMAAKAKGISFDELVIRILSTSIVKSDDKPQGGNNVSAG
ncbi:MAG: D-alanine--D-alanine ligase [Thioalkalispiraceae bacterium]|jgi:D-alanine-D-alanine ligase